MITRRLLSAFVVLAASCSPSSGIPAHEPATTVTTPLTMATSEGPQPVESTEPQTTSTLAPAEYKVQSVCPRTPEDDIASIDLGQEQGLVVRSNSDGRFYSFEHGAEGLLPLDGSVAELGSPAKYLDIAPGGRELLFEEPAADAVERTRLFSVSTDGTTRQELFDLIAGGGALTIELPDRGQSWRIPEVDAAFLARWSAPDEVTVWARQIGAQTLDPFYPVFRFNTSTQLSEILYTTEAQAGWTLGWVLGPTYSVDGKAYDVYLGAITPSTNGFFAFDREMGNRLPVFQWLKDETWMGWDYVTLTSFRYWQDAEGLLTMVIVRPGGFDVASGLTAFDVEEGDDYTNIMHSVIVKAGDIDPVGDSAAWAFIRWVVPNEGSFGLESNTTKGESRYYQVDLTTQTVKAYCQIEQTASSAMLVSPNGQYVAWTGQSRDDAQRHDTVILDLESGRYARLVGYLLLGWRE